MKCQKHFLRIEEQIMIKGNISRFSIWGSMYLSLAVTVGLELSLPGVVPLGNVSAGQASSNKRHATVWS